MVLNWGGRSYEVDYIDNNPSNNSIKNCRVVCRICHAKHIVIRKKRETGFFGETVGYKKGKDLRKQMETLVKEQRTTTPLGFSGDFRSFSVNISQVV
jgi:ssDNA-binding Zn-finger/Zn-ribbon topoisomerase 1